MIFSPHTLELTLAVDTENFEKLKNKAYKNAEKTHRLFFDGKKFIDTALTEYGIKIEYHDGKYKKKIKFIINPTILLGGDDVKKLWKPNKENISVLIQRLEVAIEDYFNSRYKLKNFKLTRMDFTVNINVCDRKCVSAYIKVLQNIGKIKGYSLKYDKNDLEIERDLSFDLVGNSNGIEFSAYDKEAQLQKKEKGSSRIKNAKGILRIEVRLMKQKSICKYTDETITAKQIKSLALNSREIFLTVFAQIVPYGDYYKKKDAVKIVEENVPKKIPREKMLRLIELIPKKKSLYLAKKEIDYRNIDKVMTMFAELNVSPVTISKRHNVKYLKNLYSYLLD